MHYSQATSLDARPAKQERNANIELERETFSLDQPKLTEMIAVIRGVKDVSVVQFSELLQLLIDSLNSNVDALKCLQSLCHEEIGEFPVNRLHFLRDSEDPLLVRVGCKVVGWRAAKKNNQDL